LPEAFCKRMLGLLGEEEYNTYLASYGEERFYGLRSNPLKSGSSQALLEKTGFHLTPVPWAPSGFYYEEGDRPGKHPYYHAGLYYIQEPSAMIPAELLDVRPGDRVLDLCAAPGGKTTQLAGKLDGRGVIVTNDNSLDRVKALAKNVELSGIRNALVMHETPDRLAERWPGYFNKILIDAPCSGEGMFRKEESMIRQWERHSVEKCAAMQEPILEGAARLLAPGGRMVYSTCTFSPEENEGMIAAFLRSHPDFKVIPAEAVHGFVNGRPEWAASLRDAAVPDEAELETAGAIRLWPHRIRGEGHFAVILEKSGQASTEAFLAAEEPRRTKRDRQGDSRKDKGRRAADLSGPLDLTSWEQFCRDALTGTPAGSTLLFGEHLYLAPVDSPSAEGLKTFRPGWYVGDLKKGRFEPSHALAMGLSISEARRVLSLDSRSETVIRYLKGETLFIGETELIVRDGAASKGFVLVCVDGFPLGWGRWAQGMLKNDYPPGWRWV
jgi:16S rRNA C967 or C1407 C5-methylase (RsmB/RsmF family)/NOL1/NOP2/fmu family ribosome biogenesis protein